MSASQKEFLVMDDGHNTGATVENGVIKELGWLSPEKPRHVYGHIDDEGRIFSARGNWQIGYVTTDGAVYGRQTSGLEFVKAGEVKPDGTLWGYAGAPGWTILGSVTPPNIYAGAAALLLVLMGTGKIPYSPHAG